MARDGEVVRPVVDDGELAVAPEPAGEADLALRHGVHRLAHVDTEVDALAERLGAELLVHHPAEGPHHGSDDGDLLI